MEIDENLKYTLCVLPLVGCCGLELTLIILCRSLQFDPAPRAGEPLVSRRVPDVRSLSRPRVRRPRPHLSPSLAVLPLSTLSLGTASRPRRRLYIALSPTYLPSSAMPLLPPSRPDLPLPTITRPRSTLLSLSILPMRYPV
jgi:hypothetical protein